ncbi:MAG: hypothetical protein WCC21_07560 [Candidatus Acidiferrales bacterium]
MPNPNLQLLTDAAKLLEPILGELVFVGGCATALLNDFRASRDLEDLMAVVDGRAELVEEIRAAESDVRSYLARQIKKLISIPEFNDALPGYLLPDAASQQRVGTIISQLGEIASL